MITFTAYTLEDPAWILKSGMSKGIHHDKQALGIIVPAGTLIRFRHTNPSPDIKLILELLNNDRTTEHYLTVSNQFTEFTTAFESVPFIRTLYTSATSKIDIEVQLNKNETLLPTYSEETNSHDFFRQWDDQQSAFALIKTKCADILVPAKDKPRLKEIDTAAGLKSLNTYYINLFELFNTLAGFQPSATSGLDRNSPNRYFMKADIKGAGSAYYGGTHTAESGTGSVAAFWLDTQPSNWGSLHEIAHGYQGLFMTHSPLYLFEVWNNVYAALYQNKHMGKEVFNRGWLYGGAAQAKFDQLQKNYDEALPPHLWYAGIIVLFLVQLFENKREHALAQFNKQYRILSNRTDFKPENHPAFEVIADACARALNIDINPLLILAGIPLSATPMANLQYANHKPVMPLYKAVRNEELESTKILLNATSQTDLFDCLELKKTGLTGSLELNLSQEAYDDLKHQDILLKAGSSLSTILNISQPTTVLPGLPIGSYTLQLPTTTNGKHAINQRYVTIKSGTTTQTLIEYEHRTGCELASQKINMDGLNNIFATIRVDTARSNIHVDVSYTQPHSYFPGRLFASITIKDRDQHIVFFKEIPGTNAILSSDSIPYGPGYTLELFNEEPSRLTMSPTGELILDTNDKHQLLSPTPQGLYNRKLSTPTSDNLETRIEQAATIFNQEKHQLLYKKHPLKEEIFLAIDTFNEPRRTQLIDKYSTLNPFNNLAPAEMIGQKLKWELKGLTYTIAQIDIDLTLQKIDVRAYRQTPHGYFNNIYLALWVVTKEGHIRLCQEYRGNVLCEDYSGSFPFNPGDEIWSLHLEPTRSLLTDTQTNRLIPVNQIQVLRVQADNQVALMKPSLD